MTRLRLLCLLLVLSTTLSAVGFGMARGQAPVAGEMIICTGHGIVTLKVDAEGNPVESHTLCPDAALGFFAATALASLDAEQLGLSRSWRNWPQTSASPDAAAPHRRNARAPPV